MRSFSLAGALLLSLAACDNGISLTGGTGDGGTGVSKTLQTEVALAVEDELEGLISTPVVPGNSTPPGSVLPAGCPTVTSLTDADHDSIPDNAVYTYANPPCQIAGFLGAGGTLSLSGTVEIRDTTSTDSTLFTTTLTDLTWNYTDPAGTRSYTAVRTGTLDLSTARDSAAISFDFESLRTRPGITAIATIDLTGTLSFLPALGDSLLVWQPVPFGTFTVDGQMQWRRSTENYTLTIATPVAISYDPSCTGTSHRFTAGQMELSGTIQGVDGTLVLTWSGCGTDAAPQWNPATP